jgi:hypothetical protein
MSKVGLLTAFVVWVTLFPSAMVAESPTPAKRQAETGVAGIISISPIHGGPTKQGVPDSKPLSNVEFVVAKDNRAVTSFRTDDEGRFQLSLPPGHYTVSRKDQKPGLGGYGQFEVDVVTGKMKQVHWECDSGIR